jgi:hypothetical protein
MKKIHIVGLALVAIFALSAFMTSSALAATKVWLVDAAALTATENVDSETTGEGLLLVDTKGGLFGERVDLDCTGLDAGTVGLLGVDKVTAITEVKCKTLEGTCPEPEAKPLHLPWQTLLTLSGTNFRDGISGTGGEPGWNVVCLKAVEDECVAKAGTTVKVENVTGGIDAIFEEAEKANCSRGGSNAGFVTGTNFILLTSGLTLSASE